MGGTKTKISYLSMLSIILLFFLFISSQLVSAASLDIKSYSLRDNETTIELSESLQVVSKNHVHSQLDIMLNNRSILQLTVDNGYFENLNTWHEQNDIYLLVVKRYNGTGGAMQFDIIKIADNQAHNLFTSIEYVKGRLELQENGEIIVTYPKYKADEPLASPSSFGKDVYKKVNNTIQLIETETNETDKYANPSFKSTIKGTNPPPNEINRLLTEKALEHGVPPEIVKAIAWQESRWQQFRTTDSSSWDIGDVVIGFDGKGIGIMQITEPNMAAERRLRLMKDIEYNIEEGIRILKEKYKYSDYRIIPKINDNNPEILEHWYFAIMAYNGISKKNDPTIPIENRSSDWPKEPYQTTIYRHIQELGLFPITPFPTSLLVGQTYYDNGSSFIKFRNHQYYMGGPLHKTYHKHKTSSIVTVTTNGVNLRKSPNGEVVRTLSKGEFLQIAGSFQYDDKNTHHFVWYPVKLLNDGNNVYYVASSYLKPLDIKDFRTDISGSNRYETSAQISNAGWTTPTTAVVLGRGDIAIDALTGNVLAKKLNSPLLLVENDKIPYPVEQEIKRLKPQKIYILGGESAISANAESRLKQISSAQIIRLKGSGRYDTALKVAQEINASTTELFIATGNESSPDALSIGAIAGKKGAPILLTTPNGLTDSTLSYIKKLSVTKVYLIGGNNVVPEIVRKQLQNIGISSSKIVRIEGSDRYRTSVEIAKFFKVNTEKLVFANGEKFIDALPGGPFAATIDAPILLTKADEVPYPVKDWLQTSVSNIPQLFFLGGDAVITANTRVTIQNIVLKNY
ncbi:cell wall-binding repeat-containing protein [Bacillus alveayuensis]|uniref:cell wall-binding repeat-containing protein n=1 Tax=Aeribacillus alveayuensis TaxID=279215 RepID=UPI0005CDA643|nr:cell wall-binding repeat-containing protein [Bacillus alveayuensis]